jgi:COMPASS component SWD2
MRLMLDTLRYLSLHDNHYIRYFKGHKKQVICLELSPTDEQFLSSSLDDTVRLWNLNSPNCQAHIPTHVPSDAQGCLNIPSPSYAAFDPCGIIFAVASHPLSAVMLYDLRNYDKEPFDTFRIQDDDYLQRLSYPPRMPEFSKLEFSNDGKSILVGTQGGVHYILDAFKGEMKARLVDHAPNMTSALSSGDVCFSPDGRFVMGGKTRFFFFWKGGS